MKEIEFTIDEDGNVEIDQRGWVGSSCAEVAEELVKALGNKVRQSKKCEYYVGTTKPKTSVKVHGRG